MLPLLLELDSSLTAVLSPGSGDAICRAVERGVADLLETLGIPGTPRLRKLRADKVALSPDRFMRLSIGGVRVRFPDDVLRYVHSYVSGTFPVPETTPADIHSWLCKLGSSVESTSLSEFFTLACVEITKRQPAILLDSHRSDAYVTRLPAPDTAFAGPRTWPPDSDSVRLILRQALGLRLSLADHQKVAAVLHQGWAAGGTLEDVAEDLIEALRPKVLELQLPPDDLKQLTTRWEKNAADMFPGLRDGMFAELGLAFPGFRFAPSEHLKPNSFALKINHLATLPMLLLEEGKCLVNDTSERLAKAYKPPIQAVPAVNPATGQPGSLIDLSDQATADKQGLTTWNPMQFLILYLAALLRKHGFCLVDRSTVREQFSQLEPAFPALIKAVRDQMPDARATRVLRDLMREQVSIRNLRRILELLLDHAILADGSPPAGDEHPHDETRRLLAFVRRGLHNEIGHKRASPGTQTVVAYLVDEQIEKIVAEREFSELDQRADRILQALRSELVSIPPTATVPNVLTTSEARPMLQAIIVSEFPRMFVIAHDELPPGANVQPIARVSMGPQ